MLFNCDKLGKYTFSPIDIYANQSIEDALNDVSDFVDEAIVSHKNWVHGKKTELEHVLQAASDRKPVRMGELQSGEWAFCAESSARVEAIVDRNLKKIQSRKF